jgi:hypothetical protein
VVVNVNSEVSNRWQFKVKSSISGPLSRSTVAQSRALKAAVRGIPASRSCAKYHSSTFQPTLSSYGLRKRS